MGSNPRKSTDKIPENPQISQPNMQSVRFEPCHCTQDTSVTSLGLTTGWQGEFYVHRISRNRHAFTLANTRVNSRFCANNWAIQAIDLDTHVDHVHQIWERFRSVLTGMVLGFRAHKSDQTGHDGGWISQKMEDAEYDTFSFSINATAHKFFFV